MKKKLALLMMLMATVLPASLVSCSDAEDGEDWDTWVMRNMLNSSWSLDRVKMNGEYKENIDPAVNMCFEMKLRANGRTFTAHRFYYKDNVKDDATEVNKSGTFTVDGKNKVIEATDSDGNKFFRLSNIEFGTGSMKATLTFYDLNKTYDEAIFSRSVSL